MDQYANYRFCDSLDYLIPPVNKTLRNFVTEREVFRNLHEINECYVSKHSLPYIKRTSEEKIQTRLTNLYVKDRRTLQTILPYENKRSQKKYKKEDKPVIKITILPKSIETQTSKLFNKRIFKNNIKSTCSNHEGFRINKVHSVSGKKREKIHQVKTSESEDFFSKRKILPNFNLQFREEKFKNSSNKMDINNFKDKRKKYRKKEMHEDSRKCKIFNSPDRLGCDVRRHKSRVTIVGRLGLTEDDRYVLNCAATVNDKPIHTNITQDLPTINTSKSVRPAFAYSRPPQSIGPKEYENPANTNYARLSQKKILTMASQGIQVNLLNDPDIKITQGAMKNNYSQCACTSTNETFKLEHENETIKGYQSPIVVISVYPNQEHHNERPIFKVEESQVSPKTRPEVEQKVSIKEKKSTVQRPISPKELSSNKKHNMKSTDNKQLSGNTSVSPNRFSNFTRKQYTLLGSSKTDVPKTKSNVRCDAKVKTSRKLSQTRQGMENRNQNKREIQNLDANGNLAKKALVDNYINRLEIDEANDNINPTRHKYIPSKNKASKVTVNIDSESERYDLLFKHDMRNTDFSVRKTLKSNKKKDITSMENLFLPNDKLLTSSTLSHDSPLEFGSIHSPRPKRDEKTIKKPSNLIVRDSIEVFHGRTSTGSPKEKKSGKNNICYTMKNNCNDKGRAKHYRGDPCSVPDPSERDKEIRQLLGILTGRNLENEPKQNARLSQESFVVKNCEGYCAENECKNNRIQLSSSLARLFPKNLVTKSQRKEDKSNINTKDSSHYREIRNNELNNRFPVIESKEECLSATNHGIHLIRTTTSLSDAMQNNNAIIGNIKTQYDYDKSIILNRNMHVFLDGEQFMKQKPVLLTRKQFNKVKRTIQNTMCKKFSNEKRKASYYSNVSIGDVRMKSQFKHVLCSNKGVQTDNVEIKIESTSDTPTRTPDKSELTTECWFSKNTIDEKRNDLKDSLTIEDKNGHLSKPRKVVSSLEVQYASVSFLKRVTYSSPTCNKDDLSYSEQRDCNSIHTIFKGHKKSVTPNLGTSAYSLSSGDTKELGSSNRSIFKDPKKKPLLQRLISCLIMRPKISNIKIEYKRRPQQNQPTRFSSFNSYNISTAFAGMEISSSLYDTTASFYTNHTIMPVSKMKRSFFSSVKGFLTHHRN